MFDNSHQRILELGPQLDHKLVGCFNGEGWCHKADVQRSTEGHEHVDCLPVIQANDGIHTFGELGANCKGQKNKQIYMVLVFELLNNEISKNINLIIFSLLLHSVY